MPYKLNSPISVSVIEPTESEVYVRLMAVCVSSVAPQKLLISSIEKSDLLLELERNANYDFSTLQYPAQGVEYTDASLTSFAEKLAEVLDVQMNYLSEGELAQSVRVPAFTDDLAWDAGDEQLTFSGEYLKGVQLLQANTQGGTYTVADTLEDVTGTDDFTIPLADLTAGKYYKVRLLDAAGKPIITAVTTIGVLVPNE